MTPPVTLTTKTEQSPMQSRVDTHQDGTLAHPPFATGYTLVPALAQEPLGPVVVCGKRFSFIPVSEPRLVRA